MNSEQLMVACTRPVQPTFQRGWGGSSQGSTLAEKMQAAMAAGRKPVFFRDVAPGRVSFYSGQPNTYLCMQAILIEHSRRHTHNPEEQEACCEIVPFRNIREATPRKICQHGYLTRLGQWWHNRHANKEGEAHKASALDEELKATKGCWEWENQDEKEGEEGTQEELEVGEWGQIRWKENAFMYEGKSISQSINQLKESATQP